jgi:hypothetical protein
MSIAINFIIIYPFFQKNMLI